MKAHEFTKWESTSDRNGGGYTFGMDAAETAKALRELADRLDAGEILPQSARVVTTAKRDDFTYTFVRFAFAEQVAKAPDGSVLRELRGPGMFPYAIAQGLGTCRKICGTAHADYDKPHVRNDACWAWLPVALTVASNSFDLESASVDKSEEILIDHPEPPARCAFDDRNITWVKPEGI